MDSNVLITVCARGGSKGVKRKNIRLLNGKPLISYTIQQALRWGKADHVVISTDSKEIASIAEEYGGEVPFIRPSELATDTAGKIPVLRHAVKTCEKIYQKEYPIIIDLDPTSPVRTISDIDKAYLRFKKIDVSTLFSVISAHKSPYFNMVEYNKTDNIQLVKKPVHPILCRQDAPVVYEMNASIYIYKRNYLMDGKTKIVLGGNSEIYIMNDWASIDIDREIDFRYVEFLLEKHIISL